MLKVVFTRRGIVGFETDQLPAALGAYSICVQATTTLVNAGTDLGVLNEEPNYQKPFPVYPSALFVGHIISAGAAIACTRPELKLGQRVLLRHRHVSHAVIDVLSTTIIALPDELSDAECALAGQAVVGLAAMHTSNLRLGSSAVVIGLGLIGQLVARMAVAAGARPVRVYDTHALRCAVAALDSRISVMSRDDLEQALADYVYVTSPTDSALQLAIRSVRPGGAVVLVAATSQPASIEVADVIFRRGVSLLGAHESKSIPSNDSAASVDAMKLCLQLIRDGTLGTEGLVSRIVAVADVNLVYELLQHKKDRVVAIALDWQ